MMLLKAAFSCQVPHFAPPHLIDRALEMFDDVNSTRTFRPRTLSFFRAHSAHHFVASIVNLILLG